MYFVMMKHIVLMKGGDFACFDHIMHQSIPPAPRPPCPGNRGAFASLVSPGGEALAKLAQPGGQALANPGGTLGLLTCTWLTLKRGRHGEFLR